MPDYSNMTDTQLKAYEKRIIGADARFRKTRIFHGRLIPLLAAVGAAAGLALYYSVSQQAVIAVGAIIFIVLITLSGIIGARLRSRVSEYRKFLKTKTEEEIKQAREEEIRLREEQEQTDRDALNEKRRMMKALGFYEESLDGFLVDLGKNRGRGVDYLAAYLLRETRLQDMMRQAFRRTERANVPQPCLFSLVFAPKLADDLQLDPRQFRNDLIAALEEQGAIKIIGDETGDVDPQKEGDFRAAIRMEVCFGNSIRNNQFYINQKALMPFDSKVNYVIHSQSDEANNKRFQYWQQNEKRQWERTETAVLLCDDNREIVAGPNFKDLKSALIDVHHSDLSDAGKLTALDLHNDPQLQQRLGMKVIRQIEPFVPTDIMIRSLKGGCRLVGYWIDGQWNDAEQTYRSRLSTSAPNYLKKGFESLLTENAQEEQQENRLLSSFISDFSRRGEKFSRAVSSQGNFVVRRGAVSHDSRIHKFFIRPHTETGAFTRFYRKPLGAGDGDYQNIDKYSDFHLNRDPQCQLEEEGFFPLLFSECYLLTGAGSVVLCLEMDLGSPAIGEGIGGMVQYDEITLKVALQKFAYQKGVEDYDYLESKAAQGFLARGRIQNRMHYFKLLEPPHVRAYRPGDIVNDLKSAQILPDEIKAEMVNTKGEPGGEILVFTTPEYQKVGDFLTNDRASSKPVSQDLLIGICDELERFCFRVIKAGIICSDFSLEDTMFSEKSLEDCLQLDASETMASRPGLFVGDYGSYTYLSHFSRESKINRGEYMAPEDWDHTLEFTPEGYQVFAVGALCLEVLLRQPGLVPHSLANQQSLGGKQGYTETLRLEVKSLLISYNDAIVEHILKMLSYDPRERPRPERLVDR